MLDRTKAPPAQALTNPKIPKAYRHLLPNGVRLNTVDQGEQPIVYIELIFPVGRTNEPLPGLTYYLFKMISEGTSRKSSSDIAESFDFFGSHLEITPTLDHVHIKLYALHRFYRASLQLLAEMLTESNFPKENFEIIQTIRVQQIKQQLAKNNAYASLKLREKLFGAAHPYGMMMNEDQARAISVQKVLQHRKLLLAKPQVFMAGKLTNEILKTTEDVVGQIPFEDYHVNTVHDIESGSSESLIKEASTQASIRLGTLSLNRDHSDIHTFKIMNTLLGGYFGSRLMKNIREEKGLTYGIHSSLTHLQTHGYWHIGSEVLDEKVQLALDEIKAEIKRLQDTPPEEEEIQTVTSYLKGKFLMSFDTPFNSISMLKALYLQGLDESYFKEYYERLLHISAAEVSQVAQKHIPDSLTTLVVS